MGCSGVETDSDVPKGPDRYDARIGLECSETYNPNSTSPAPCCRRPSCWGPRSLLRPITMPSGLDRGSIVLPFTVTALARALPAFAPGTSIHANVILITAAVASHAVRDVGDTLVLVLADDIAR